MGGERQSDRPVDGGNLLDHSDVVHVGEPGTAVLFREDRPEETELAEFPEDLAREALRFVPFHDVGPDLGLGEFPRRLADRLLLGGQDGAHPGNSSAAPPCRYRSEGAADAFTLPAGTMSTPV